MSLTIWTEGSSTSSNLAFGAIVTVESLTLQNVISLSIAMMLMVANGTAWRNYHLGKHIIAP